MGWSDRRNLKRGKQENDVEQSREIEARLLGADPGGHCGYAGALRRSCSPWGNGASGSLSMRTNTAGPSFVGDTWVLLKSLPSQFLLFYFILLSISPFFQAVSNNQWGKHVIQSCLSCPCNFN